MHKRAILIAITLMLMILVCQRNPGPLVSFPTSTATLTPKPLVTHTPTPTPTPSPSPTPVPAAHIHSGDLALFYGDWEKALQEYQTALNASIDPEVRAAAMLGVGRTRLLARNYYEAVRVLDSLIQDYPDAPHLPQAYFFLAQAQEVLEHPDKAAEAYEHYLALRPGVIDAYIQDRRGDALFTAGDYGGAAKAFSSALSSPSLLDSIFLQLKMARSYALVGDSTTALALYDDAYKRTNDDYTRALANLRKGQIFISQGETEQAYNLYLENVRNYPKAFESYSALQALVEAGVPVDELERGLVDYYAGEYGVALAAFDRYLQKEPADPATALYYNGLARLALGGNQDAIAQWDQIIENYPDHRFWDEAWEQKAYTQWAYMEQYDQALETLLAFVEKVPGHLRAAEFLYDAAGVAERKGDLQQAAALYERVINAYPNDERAGRALFLAGITHYRTGDYQPALMAFQRYLSLVATLSDRSAAYFWIAKTQQALGDLEAALASWETTAGVDPTGYYSERARDILHDRPPFTPPEAYDIVNDLQAERAKADEWMRQRFELAPDADLSGLGSLGSDPGLQRAQELWDLGIYDDARAEFEALRLSVQTDPVLTYRLSNYLLDIGSYRSAILAGRQVLDLALLDDAASLSAPAYFNHMRFGAYYSDLIFPLAKSHDFHPLFLFSLVRQESLFEGFVRSAADARGLMQIIPVTGADIAKNLVWPDNYADDDLFRPLVSLTYGVNYLKKQRAAFDGDLYAALAAYNGGPGNALQWKQLAPNDPDLFLEVIRYEETRKYIRGVYEVFAIYRWLYNRTP